MRMKSILHPTIAKLFTALMATSVIMTSCVKEHIDYSSVNLDLFMLSALERIYGVEIVYSLVFVVDIKQLVIFFQMRY